MHRRCQTNVANNCGINNAKTMSLLLSKAKDTSNSSANHNNAHIRPISYENIYQQNLAYDDDDDDT